MARIKDVAKEAGVAPSTVSLVLNHKGYVSQETREKVEAAVKRLHYVPSEVARNLSLSRTHLIGIIVPSVAHPFFAELVEHLEEALFQLGYQTMLCCTRQKENAEQTFLDMLQRKMMDGIIMGAHSLDVSIYDRIERPIVAFDRYLNDHIPIIHSDHELGGRLAAEALLRHGCHHVIDIAGAQSVRTPANTYHWAFQETVRAHGVAIDVIEMAWNAFDYEDFLQTAHDLLEKYPDADGIFGPDLAVAACMNLASTAGHMIPKDLKLVAYDGTIITRMGMKTITAVRQDIGVLAQIAARKIVNRVNGIEDHLPWVVKPVLFPGETC